MLYCDRQPDRPCPDELVTLIACDLALALGYAHGYVHTDARHHTQQGVVHRDISPSNVLVSTSGEIKLTDFGIAKVVRPGELTRTTSIKGKLAYMSPEQLRGKQARRAKRLICPRSNALRVPGRKAPI